MSRQQKTSSPAVHDAIDAAKPVPAKKQRQSATRTRTFATIVYPTEEEYRAYYKACGGEVVDRYGEAHKVPEYDGAEGWGAHPADWREIIIGAHVAALISPMHIGDVNPDGKVKKPHWHVLIIYDGVKSYETQVKPFFDSFGGVGREDVQSARGYARYLCHMDNPEKCQYNPEDVIAYGGADYKAITQMPTDDINELYAIIDIIEANHIVSYRELIQRLRINRPELAATALTRFTLPLKEYMRSMFWEDERAAYGHERDRHDTTQHDTTREEHNHESND